MGTRLGVATLLLGGTLLIALEDRRGFDSFTPQFLVSLIAVIFGASLVFAVWLLGSAHRDRVALAQVGTDLIVTTGLVYVTGGAGSGFTFLYGVAVLMAAMVVGPMSARVTGGAAIALYTLLAGSLAAGWLAPPPDQATEAYLLPDRRAARRAGLLNVLGPAARHAAGREPVGALDDRRRPAAHRRSERRDAGAPQRRHRAFADLGLARPPTSKAACAP